MGISPSKVASEVIRIGRSRTLQASHTASWSGIPSLCRCRSKFHDQDAVGYHDASHHHHAHQGHDIEGCAGHPENKSTPARPGGTASENDERIDEGTELSHQDEINQNDGEKQTERKAKEGLIHADDSALHTNGGIFGKGQTLQQMIDLAVDAAEVLSTRHDVNIDDAPDLVVIDFSGSIDRLDSGNRL